MHWFERAFSRNRVTAQGRLFDHLRAKEAELQALTDALPQLIWSADALGKRDYCNARWFEYTGLTEAESFGDAWLKALHPDDFERVREAWHKARNLASPYETEARLRGANGEYRWFMARAIPVFDKAGSLIRWLGTVTDIHHHRVLEEQQERAQRALRVLANVGRALSEETTQRHLIEQVLKIVVADVCDWAYVALADGDVYRIAGIAHRNSAQRAFAAMFAGMTLKKPTIPPEFTDSLRVLGTCAQSSVPLTVGGKSIGELQCTWSTQNGPDPGMAEVLAEVGLRLAAAIDRARVHDSLVTALQSVFTEQRLPRITNVGFSAVYLPAMRGALIGGDWYDAVELPDGRIFIAIGDVGGHGLEAAIAMNRARQAMFASAAAMPEPASVLDRVHDILELTHSPMATALCGFLDPATFTLSYASAGHSPPVLACSDRGAYFLPVDGAPLGIGFPPSPRTFSVRVPPHALLVFYTDGLTESKRNLLSGEQQLLEVCDTVRSAFTFAPADAIRNAIVGDSETRDDLAILALSFGVPKRDAMPVLSENVRAV